MCERGLQPSLQITWRLTSSPRVMCHHKSLKSGPWGRQCVWAVTTFQDCLQFNICLGFFHQLCEVDCCACVCLNRKVKKGSLLIDSSTIDPAVSKEMAVAAEKMGAVFMDAPVSGGRSSLYFLEIVFGEHKLSYSYSM